MTWIEHSSWSLKCDNCRFGWNDWPAPPRFDTRDLLTRYVLSIGWTLMDHRALCAECTHAEACAVIGHVWGPWEQPLEVVLESGEIRLRQVRFCIVCTAGQYDPPSGPLG